MHLWSFLTPIFAFCFVHRPSLFLACLLPCSFIRFFQTSLDQTTEGEAQRLAKLEAGEFNERELSELEDKIKMEEEQQRYRSRTISTHKSVFIPACPGHFVCLPTLSFLNSFCFTPPSPSPLISPRAQAGRH